MAKRMKVAKSSFAWLLASLMIVALIAGCSGKNNNEASGSPSASQAENSTKPSESASASASPSEDPFAEHMDISIALWSIGDAMPEGFNDPIRDAVEKKLNVTIKPVNTTWDDYTQKIQVWAASDQLPDVFAIDAITSPNLTSWITQGVVHELPADLSPYPELAKLFATPDFQSYRFPLGDTNGKFYSIPRPNFRDANMNANSHGIIVRKDWMANVGITKAPETMDEFIALMKAFVEKDPDKNGKKDTIGLTAYSPSWLADLFGAYEPGLMGGKSVWVRGDGKWVPAFSTARATEGVKAIKALYDAGGLDKDFATIKSGEATDKFASGLAGAYAHDTTPGTLRTLKTKYEELNPDKKFEDAFMILPPIKNVDGNFYRFYDSGIWSESYINAKADDKKVDRILRLFDYIFSEEGFNLLHFGIEGVDYEKKDGQISMIDQKDADGKPLVLMNKYPFMKASYLTEWSGTSIATNPLIPQTLRDMSEANFQWMMQNAKPVDTDLRLNFIDYPSRTKAVEQFDVDLVKAVLSKNAEETWNKITQGYMNGDYKTIVEELNAKAKEMGINP
ncbi:extracellular solute-binding protein [Cohnella soli]|uniref:Extracellular solute-binding protein n=1 Tax=Cohnella soli TaxID=425005 RepID=A0ABW0HQD6_9BACL